jgi:hypothetical protein
MFGCFPSALSGSREIEIGLDRTRADDSRRRFDGIEEQAVVFQDSDDDVLSLGRGGQLQLDL